MIIVIYTRGKTDKTSRMLRRRLAEWKVFFDEQSPSKQPSPGTVLSVGAVPYTIEEIKTRDMLWKALYPELVDIDPAQAPSFCPDGPEDLSEEKINEKVYDLIRGGDVAIRQYFNQLSVNQQEVFITAVRLQRHRDAHLLIEFSGMMADWLDNKSKSLDPYIGWKPEKEFHKYMWWVE
jgi:hypothetical protein